MNFVMTWNCHNCVICSKMLPGQAGPQVPGVIDHARSDSRHQLPLLVPHNTPGGGGDGGWGAASTKVVWSPSFHFFYCRDIIDQPDIVVIACIKNFQNIYWYKDFHSDWQTFLFKLKITAFIWGFPIIFFSHVCTWWWKTSAVSTNVSVWLFLVQLRIFCRRFLNDPCFWAVGQRLLEQSRRGLGHSITQ